MTFLRKRRPITIDDVALEAGVSAKTVSRVLNNEPNVRPTKRELVLKAARNLGYKPNPAARSLAGARSFLLAHLHDNPVPEYVSAVNQGIYKACRANGYFLLPEPVDSRSSDWLDRIQSFLMTSRADGVILSPPLADNPEVLSLLQNTETPYARLSPANREDKTPSMRMDDSLASQQLTQHLINYGHSKIAYISGPEGHTASTERHKGYIKALTAAYIQIRPDYAAAGDYSMRSGHTAALKFLKMKDRPTAIMAANDDMAVGALTAIMAAGLSIPGDISLTGFDDTRLAAAVWPSLTTVRQPVSAMARRAAERLMVPADDSPLQEMFDFELVVRQSTGKLDG